MPQIYKSFSRKPLLGEFYVAILSGFEAVHPFMRPDLISSPPWRGGPSSLHRPFGPGATFADVRHGVVRRAIPKVRGAASTARRAPRHTLGYIRWRRDDDHILYSPSTLPPQTKCVRISRATPRFQFDGRSVGRRLGPTCRLGADNFVRPSPHRAGRRLAASDPSYKRTSPARCCRPG